MHTKKKLVIAGAASLAGIIILAKLFGGQDNVATQFQTATVSIGSIRETVTASGTINPITTVQVGTQVSGIVKKIYADFNSNVQEGDLIAQIDESLFQAQLDQSRAHHASVRAGVAKATAELVEAERSFARAKELHSQNFISKSDLDTVEMKYQTAKAQAELAKAQLDQAGAALKLAETNLRYTKIKAPVTGVVISRNVDEGQTVASSFQTPTLFTIAQDLAKMKIDTNVNESDIGRVAEGQKAEFTVDAYPESKFTGQVMQVRNSPTTIQNVVTYNVVVEVANPDLRLKPGMTANVAIVTATKEKVIRVPSSALRFKPAGYKPAPDEPKGYAVWVLDNGTPKRVPVTTGIGDVEYTEIKGDITDGQEVIVGDSGKNAHKSAGHMPRMF